MKVNGLPGQWKPTYSEVLNWLPLLGSLSAFLTFGWLGLLLWQWRKLPGSRTTRIGWVLFASGTIAFVPYLAYWNLLGLNLH
jgi:hypothetical protein